MRWRGSFRAARNLPFQPRSPMRSYTCSRRGRTKRSSIHTAAWAAFFGPLRRTRVDATVPSPHTRTDTGFGAGALAHSPLTSAADLSRFCDVPAVFNCKSFTQTAAEREVADGIISLLPLNVRLNERVPLTRGGDTGELDIAILDRVTQWLRPGGRAVLAVTPRLLFAESAAPVRAQLGEAARVVAVIELPNGVLNTTNIAIGILVIERSLPTSTLVARLRSDWFSQISDGDFFRAYEQHHRGSGK